MENIVNYYIDYFMNTGETDMNIVFDVDDTLYDLMAPFQAAHEKFFASQTAADATELFMKSRLYSDMILAQEKQGLTAPEDAFAKRIQMTYQDVGLSVSREKACLFEQEYRLRQKEIALFPCMERMLNACQEAQVPMAVLTNGNSRGQRRKISALKLERWFDNEHIFISGETGYQKPDVMAFRHIEDRLGYIPEDTWYVGDTYEADIISAHQAGWHSIWFNHRKRARRTDLPVAAVEVQSKENILDVIRNMVLKFSVDNTRPVK